MSDSENQAKVENGEKKKSRQRQRDPKPRLYYPCQTVAELGAVVKKHMDEAAGSLIPEMIVCQCKFRPGALFSVDVPVEPPLDPQLAEATKAETTLEEALYGLADEQAQLKKQRSVAKAIREGITVVDGYSYLERRVWSRKDDDGHCFKFVCHDSVQNRDRAANAPSGRSRKREGSEEQDKEYVPRSTNNQLPTYDCKGSLTVTFSAKESSIDVMYRHLHIHRDISARGKLVPQSSKEVGMAPYPVGPYDNGNDLYQAETPFPFAPDAFDSSVPTYGNVASIPQSSTENRQEKPKKKRKPRNDAGQKRKSKDAAETLVGLMHADPYVPYAMNNGYDGAQHINGSSASASSPKKKRKQSNGIDNSERRKKGTACVTCRRRKVKCSGEQPDCLQCSKTGRSCFWTDDEG